MKSLKTIIGIVLAATSIGGAIAVASVNSTQNLEIASAWEDKWYIAGSFNSWSETANQMTKISDSGNYNQWKFTYNFSNGAEFKFVYHGGSYEWYTASLDGYSHAASAITTPSNHKINSAGNYNLILKCEKNGGGKVLYYEQYSSVTLDKQNGTGGTSSITPVYGTAMPSITIPTKTGYTFGGYFANTNGSGTQYCNADGSSKTNWNLTNTNKTLYAKWTASVYTITYDRNKSNGLQQTQSKTHGTDVTAYTPGTSPINASGWDPSPFKRFLYWNTAYSGDGDTVNAGSTITSNSSFTLYYVEEWYKYRYRVDSGLWINLVQNDDGKGSGIQVQFAPSTAQSLPLHGMLSFQYSSDGGTNWTDISSASITFEGNYNTSTGIQLATVDTIYLKISDGNTYSCWVPGISDRTICVFDSSSATTGGTPYSMRGNGNNETVTTTDVIIEKGQFVKRGYSGNYAYGSKFKGGTGTAASCFSQVGTNTAVECLKTGVYTVYNQSGNDWADMWFTRNEEASASYLAQQFNSIVGTICTGVNGGTKSLEDLQNVWGSKSSTTLYKHFNDQIPATLAYFGTSSTTTDDDILECVERYDYIERKYGTTALPDFIGRNNNYQSAPQNTLSTSMFNETSNSSNVALIVTLISIIGITGTVGYFVFKKRHE